MKKESFKSFLMTSNQSQNIDTLIAASERLESSYEIDLDEIVSTETKAQKLRISVYFDHELTPLDRKLYPDVIKSYFQFIHNATLPPLNFKTKV
ncbi:hypothetical protein [Crassaminicella profunda]|uniref:hypothetical protein n=1 Tax=Crassaminicella profunda TaxID=1286698 RepID=UPI001CA788B6|nr:hypothetical protein [Crassaminicella profunda]QZY53677.1 hypothetical protein K7H06_11455 [Crassaminicella profunda]